VLGFQAMQRSLVKQHGQTRHYDPSSCDLHRCLSCRKNCYELTMAPINHSFIYEVSIKSSI
jgi:hypothetical protein